MSDFDGVLVRGVWSVMTVEVGEELKTKTTISRRVQEDWSKHASFGLSGSRSEVVVANVIDILAWLRT